MRELTARFRPFFLFAGVFSLAINLLLLAPTLYMLQVFDRVLASRSEETLVVLSIATAVALLAMSLLEALRSRLLAAAGAALDRKLGPPVLEGLLAQAAKAGGGEYVHGLRDVATLRTVLTGQGVLSLYDVPWLPLFLIIIFLFHPLLGVVAVAGALVMGLLAIMNERMTREPLERAQAQARRAGRLIDANLRNAEVTAALGMLPAVTRHWMAMNDTALRSQMQATNLGGSFTAATKFMRQFIQIAMLAMGAWLVVDQHVTSGIMIAGTILLSRALAPVESLIASWRGLVEARSAWARLSKLLENDSSALTTKLPEPKGALKVERAVFGIKGVERPILRGVSFDIAPGEMLGVIGPSASGKSTLARLVVGVWKPSSGVVRLDGADVAAWPRGDLGPYVGYVPQDVELFGGTVAQNIARMGEPDAAKVVQAAQSAQVHELILRLPKGYDTEIGDGGSSLSPGQRQRIALARALYGTPRLVVLDEPNANLDREGEEALLGVLQRLKKEAVTVVLVAHRPSLLVSADKLLVLREGNVDLFGSRAEVMARVTRPALATREVA
ncbi:MAG: ATP-binding cassette, subfamily type secretion system permease/ATPase [Betaproteobacteria bacterium]|jgi:PrtD family type I secretion system ABC transporter|nr:ATP-binding cassette, subfamily type secretion system permease/ATPase [Betaproteobacteria bacterium]